MTTRIHSVDRELVEAAARVARTRCRGDNHTMAAAGRGRDGRIVTAVNAYHFTGGPAPSRFSSAPPRPGGSTNWRRSSPWGPGPGGVPPCGRCRQVLLDYFPGLRVVVGEGEDVRAVPIAELLPVSYVWADHQVDAR